MEEKKTKRCFIAIDLPDNIKRELCRIQEALPKINKKNVEKENLHLTLKFLGDVSGEMLEKIKESLSKIKLKRFIALLKEIGFFPNEKFIRIIWAGLGDLNSDKDLFSLQKVVEESLKNLVPRDEKEWMPHITVTRVKNIPKNKKEDFIKKIKEIIPKQESFEVKQIKLKQSTLTEKGSIYEDLLVVELE